MAVKMMIFIMPADDNALSSLWTPLSENEVNFEH